jgi:hypothetical protein
MTTKTSGAFPEVAIIRKGAPKEKRMRDGREYETVGKDLGERFRVVFHPGAGDLEQRFLQEYGTMQPEKIRAMLPFSQAAHCWEAWNEAYNAGRLIARADGDHYIVKRDPMTGEYVVRDEQPHTPWQIGDQIEYERNGKPYALKFRPYGRLKLFLPYTVGASRFVHFVLKTTSYYDCVNIEANLEAVQNLANVLNRGNAAGIPIILYRRLTDICWNHPDGTASREKKWLVYLEIDPEWVGKAIKRLNTLALGDSITAMLPAETPVLSVSGNAPDPAEDDDLDESEYTDAVDAEAHDVPEHAPEPDRKMTRPYDGSALRERLKQKAAAKAGRVASDKQRNLVGAMMSELFAGCSDSEARKHALQTYLTGKAHMKDISDAYVLALLDWLDPKKDSGGAFLPDGMAVKEAQTAFTAALQEQGQGRMV